jgi:hypothetical protein
MRGSVVIVLSSYNSSLLQIDLLMPCFTVDCVGCVSLVALDVSCIPRITSAAIFGITKTCRNLQKLFAEQCISVMGDLHVTSPVWKESAYDST